MTNLRDNREPTLIQVPADSECIARRNAGGRIQTWRERFERISQSAML